MRHTKLKLEAQNDFIAANLLETLQLRGGDSRIAKRHDKLFSNGPKN